MHKLLIKAETIYHWRIIKT